MMAEGKAEPVFLNEIYNSREEANKARKRHIRLYIRLAKPLGYRITQSEASRLFKVVETKKRFSV